MRSGGPVSAAGSTSGTSTGTATVARGDLAWSSAQPGIGSLAGVPLGSVAAPWAVSLVLTAARADATVDLISVAADGTATVTALTVLAGTTVSTPVKAAAASLWLRVHSGSVNAALATSYTDATGVLRSVAPLGSAPLLTAPVAVHPLAG